MDAGQRRIYEMAVEHFGVIHQMIKTMEECGELTQALAKVVLSKDLAMGHAHDDLIGELADVQIMIHQLSIYLGQESFDKMVIGKTGALSIRIAMEIKDETSDL